MPIGTGLALGLGLASVAGGIGSAAIGANAAGNAAGAQVNAANYAADLQKQEADQALQFQKDMWNTQQGNIAPWLQTGRSSLSMLGQLMGLPGAYNLNQPGPAPPKTVGQVQVPADIGGKPFSAMARTTMGTGPGGTNPGGYNTGGPPVTGTGSLNTNGNLGTLMTGARTGIGLPAGSAPTTGPGNPLLTGGGTGQPSMQPFAPWSQQFVAPTNVTEQNDPGYQFRLNQGTQALDRSAAAKGDLLSGAGIKPYERYAQDYASNEYGNVYNRALGQYQQNYNIFQNNQANEWNRLASLSGLGQTSAAQLNSAGGQAAGNMGNIYMNLGQGLANQANNAGAARASGYVGGANAWNGALGGAGNNLMQLMLMNQLYGGGGGGGNIGGSLFSMLGGGQPGGVPVSEIPS